MLHRSRLAFYAVYDGHGGARASRHAAQQLHENLAARFPKGKTTTTSFIFLEVKVMMYLNVQVTIEFSRKVRAFSYPDPIRNQKKPALNLMFKTTDFKTTCFSF